MELEKTHSNVTTTSKTSKDENLLERLQQGYRKVLGNMPASCRNNYKRAMTGKYRAAGVKAFCLECRGWERAEVKKCNSIACPLYPYRPYK